MRFASGIAGLVLVACAAPPCPHASAPAPASVTPVAAAPPPICTPPSGTETEVTFNGAPMIVVCHDVYVEPEMTSNERTSVMRWYAEGVAELGRLFGGAHDGALIPLVACKTAACAAHFAGPTRRSRVVSVPRPTIIIAGIGPLSKPTFVHEMIHVAIERRTAGKPQVPAWFNEGVATYLSDNVVCNDEPPILDDLRRLARNSAWNGFTEQPSKIHGAYCQARDEIGAWAAIHGKDALVPLIDSVAAGRSFDEAYGPLVKKGAPSLQIEHALVAKLGFDESTDVIDGSAHPHRASLLAGATRTKGHRGSALRVKNGGYLRVDGLEEYGLPDAPFTVSMWVNPTADAKVLVHTSRVVEGSNGWCLSLLGFDPAGHLVAQVPFAPDPKAFLTVTGPILKVGAWSHVTVSWSEGNGLSLYTDGKLAASAPPASAEQRHRDATASPMFLFFGSDHGGQCWTSTLERGDFDGAIDDVHVYSYALTPQEVAADMTKK